MDGFALVCCFSESSGVFWAFSGVLLCLWRASLGKCLGICGHFDSWLSLEGLNCILAVLGLVGVILLGANNLIRSFWPSVSVHRL